jgi:hypothetical protein
MHIIAPTIFLSINIRNMSGVPCTLEGRISKTRKPKVITSTLRHHLVYVYLHLNTFNTGHLLMPSLTVIDITSRLPISATSTLLQFMLLSLEEKTRSNYSTGLLRFTQFCDSHKISEVVISAFIASYTSLCSLDCINGWLSGIKWWHTFQGAEWNGRDMLATVKKGIAKLVPNSSRRDKREPVTLERMHCLLRGLDLSNAKDAAIYAASSIAFHGICRFANNN